MILISMVALALANCVPIAIVVENLGQFSYDLTALPQIDLIPIYINNKPQYISFGFYSATNCTVPALVSDQNCNPLTITAIIMSCFAYIDGVPSNGIAVNYLPYINNRTEVTSVTRDVLNTTTNVMQQVTQNITTTTLSEFKVSLQIRCQDSQLPYTKKCQMKPSSNQSISSTNIINHTIYSYQCQTQLPQGCPLIRNNNFWEFLYASKLWFAFVLWVFSLFLLFFGYFVIRFTIFLYGVTTAATFAIVFSAMSYSDFFYDGLTSIHVFMILLSFLLGFLFGIFLLTMPKLGYINIGLWVGIIFSLLLQNAALYATGSLLAFWITLGVSGAIMMGVAIMAFSKFIILSSSFISSFWIIRTLGFFLPYYPNQFQTQNRIAIKASTPWQFYLYLTSILVLTILGSTFQFCWYRKKGRDAKNKSYYLEEEGTLKQKFKKLIEFKEVKEMINNSKEGLMFLKNLVVEGNDDDSGSEDNTKRKKKQNSQEIELKKMNKLSKNKPPTPDQSSEDQYEPVSKLKGKPIQDSSNKAKKEIKKFSSLPKEQSDYQIQKVVVNKREKKGKR